MANKSTKPMKIKKLHPRQKEIALDIISTPSSDCKYFMIRASRQSGKTYLMEHLAFFIACNSANFSVAIILATNSQTRKVHKSMIKWLPKHIVQNYTSSDGNRAITFVNGTEISFYSAGSYDSIAGNSFDYIFGDEMGLWIPMAWSIIRPTTAAKKDAKVILCSTPRGEGNDFHKLCLEGMDAEIEFVKHYRMSYLDNPMYDTREVESARKSMPEGLFRQEYLAEFIDSLGNIFGDITKVQTITSFKKTGSRFFYGVDVAGDGQDKTVLTILNAKGDVVHMKEVVDPRNAPSSQARLIKAVLDKYPGINGYVEKTGIGHGLYKAMLDLGIKVQKWDTGSNSKQELVTNLIEDISEETISLPTPELCEYLDKEMREYIAVRTPKTNALNYSHQGGGHDDFLDSLMMANMARKKLVGRSHSVRFTGNDSRNKYRPGYKPNYKYRI